MNAHEKMAKHIAYKNACDIIGGLENTLLDYPEDDPEYIEAKNILSLPQETLVDYIYSETMHDSNRDYLKHLRFAGEEYIRNYLRKLLTKWGYTNTIANAEKENTEMKYQNRRNNTVIATIVEEFVKDEQEKLRLKDINTGVEYTTLKKNLNKTWKKLEEEQPEVVEQPAEPKEEPKTEEKVEEPKTEETKYSVRVLLKAFTGMVIGEFDAEIVSGGYRVVTKAGKTLKFNKDGEQVGLKSYRFANSITLV